MSDITADGGVERAFQPEDQEALRAQVRQVMATEEKAMTAVSREAGVAYGTFSAWMGGTYTGRNDKIAAEVAKWLSARQAQQRTRAMMPAAPGFIMTKSAGDYWQMFEHAQHMPDMVSICGDAGTGKTCAAVAYKASHPNVWMMTGEPCLNTARMVLEAISDALGICEKYSAQRISRAVVTKLAGSGGLLIIDEAQHLTTQSLDQVRTVHDKAGVGVALLGNDTSYSRFETVNRTAQFAQLFSRIGMRMRRQAPAKGDIEALLDAWQIEGAGERKLLYAIARKPGALRGMTKALRMAHMLANAESVPLAEAHIASAWQQLGNAEIKGAA